MYSYRIRIHWPRTLFKHVYSYLLQGKFLRKREVRVSNSKSMVLRFFFTYVYVYWIRNSGPKTKECACIFWGTPKQVHSKRVVFDKRLMSVWRNSGERRRAIAKTKRCLRMFGERMTNVWRALVENYLWRNYLFGVSRSFPFGFSLWGNLWLKGNHC